MFKYFGTYATPRGSPSNIKFNTNKVLWNNISCILTLSSSPCLPPKDFLWLTGLCVQNSSVPLNTEAIHSTWHRQSAASSLLSNRSLNPLFASIPSQVRDGQGEEKGARSPSQIWEQAASNSLWKASDCQRNQSPRGAEKQILCVALATMWHFS